MDGAESFFSPGLDAPPGGAQGPDGQPQMTKSAGDAMGNIIKKLIGQAERDRRWWRKLGREVYRYGFSPDYDFEYQTLPTTAFFLAKYALTAEAIQVMGPYLYQSNPSVQAVATDNATPQGALRGTVTADYINEAGRLCDSYTPGCDAINDYLVYGRGVLWTGLHPQNKAVYSARENPIDIVVDPEARSWPEVKWVARRRTRAKDDVIAEYPDAKEAIEALPKAAIREGVSLLDYERKDHGSQMVVYWEFLCLTGLQHFHGGGELKKAGFVSDEPKMYLVGQAGEFLTMTDWAIPFHKSDHWKWPLCPLDGFKLPDTLLPQSPLAVGLGFQRALNWIVTLMLGKYRYTSRLVFALASQNGQGLDAQDKDRVLIGNEIEAIEITMNGETKSIKDFIQEFQWNNDWLEPSIMLLDKLRDLYGKATGLYDVLYSGDTEKVDRSAAASQIRDRNSRSRIESMRDAVLKWQTLKCQQEAFAARFTQTREDIAAMIGDQAAQNWGFLATPEKTNPQYWMQHFAETLPVTTPQDMQQLQMMAQNMAAQAVTLEQASREVDFQLEASSIRRKDIDQQLDVMKDYFNQTGSVQIQSQDPYEKSIAYMALGEYYHLAGMSPDLVNSLRGLAQRYQQMGQAMDAANAAQAHAQQGRPAPQQQQGAQR
jgi:hypothetical protein